MVKVRYAPSPTGELHLGNIRILVINYLFALVTKGKFIVRIDDTDTIRSQQKYTDHIVQVLEYLKVKYEKMAFQSQRIDIYNRVFKQLQNKGYIYPCYETAEEIEHIQKSKKRRKMAPIFRKEDRLYMEGHGNNMAYWRLCLADKMKFTDNIFGSKEYERTWSDPVIRKPNGDYCYMFTSVVDDIEMGITHIIRGTDHLSNSVMQQYLGNCIIGTTWHVNFFHISMLQKDGQKISKRNLTDNIDVLSLEPATLFIIFSTLGTNKKPQITTNIEEIASTMDINKFNKSPIEIPDYKQIININRKVLAITHGERLQKNKINPHIWECFKENIQLMQDIKVIQKKILAIDLNQIEFLKHFNNQLDLETQIDQYVQTNNLDKNQFLSDIRKTIIGDQPGPQSISILKMLLNLKK